MEWKNNERGIFRNVKDYFLNNLGVNSLDCVNDFFKKSSSNGYSVTNLKKAVDLVKKFQHKPVHIIGDYDVDGVCATTILFRGLKEYGFTDLHYRIPRRFSEGFGINTSIIDEINNTDALVITCDNGIAGLDAIKLAKERGLTVVVTDHHQPVMDGGNMVLPEADVIVDPNAISNPDEFCAYCGAGLAYKFIVELFDFDSSIRTKYLPYAAVATVCDCVALNEENYVFVRQGLKLLSNPATCPMAFSKLLKAFSFEDGNLVTEIDLGFKIGPAINSCSRMADTGANRAVEFLCSEEETLTTVLADELYLTNQRRKEVEAEVTQKAIDIIKSEGYETLNPILVALDDAHEGVIGIVASSIAERFHVPAFVFTKKTKVIDTDEGIIYKGSARTWGDYDIKAELDKVSDLIYQYGGHKGAAGISVLPEKFVDLIEALNNNNSYSSTADESLVWDIEVSASEVPFAIEELSKYAPWGEANPLPKFHIVDFVPELNYGVYYKIMGANADCIKIFGSNDTAAVAFHLPALPNVDGSKLEFVAELADSVFKGHVTHQIQFLDIRSV